MNIQIFITLLVVGLLAGLVAAITSKNFKANLTLYLVVSVAGAFLGWFVLRQINFTVIQVGFALGGSLLLLWLVRLIQK